MIGDVFIFSDYNDKNITVVKCDPVTDSAAVFDVDLKPAGFTQEQIFEIRELGIQNDDVYITFKNDKNIYIFDFS